MQVVVRRLIGRVWADSPRSDMDDELEAAVADEARRGVRFVLPFLLPVLYLVSIILGHAFDRPSVQVAVWVAVAIVVGRWALLAATRQRHRQASRTRRSVYATLFTLSAWVVSGGFAAIYFTAAPALDGMQMMTLTVVATAICAVAILSTSASLLAYFGYVTIHLGAIVGVMLGLHDKTIMPGMPLMVGFLAVALAAIATRSNLAVREKIRLGLRVRESSLRDALTGLRNRSFIAEHGSHLAASIVDEWTAGGGRRRPVEKRSLALFVVDLDHFKAINDTYGHSVGDDVLVAFARVAQSTVRAPDVVSRWGGEEFLVLMQVTDRASVAMIAERIHTRVAAHRIPVAHKGDVRVTCSIGACLFPFDAQSPAALTWEETLVLADSALYEAKRTGRNRAVCISTGDKGVAPKQALALARASLRNAVEVGAVAL